MAVAVRRLDVRWPTALLAGALVGTSACAGLLGIRPTDATRPFEHRAHAEAGVHCLSCHDGIASAGDAGDLHLPSTNTCTSCHEEPHDPSPCGACHGLSYTRASAARAKATLVFDHGAHREATSADCVRCHADAGSGAAVMRPRMADCLGCHGHDEAFAVKNCDSCHVDLRGEGTRPDDHFIHGSDFTNAHAAAASRADGMCATCHAPRFCTSCHVAGVMPITPGRLRFDEPRSGGLHPAGFLSHHAEASAASAGLCTTCHAPESCASCHDRQRLGATRAEPTNPHPPGWIGPRGSGNLHGPATWRDPASCEACHGGAGQRLCVKCHAVGAGGGDPHMPGSKPTGDRARMPCSLCHTGGR